MDLTALTPFAPAALVVIGVVWVLADIGIRVFDRCTGRDTEVVCCEHCADTAEQLGKAVDYLHDLYQLAETVAADIAALRDSEADVRENSFSTVEVLRTIRDRIDRLPEHTPDRSDADWLRTR